MSERLVRYTQCGQFPSVGTSTSVDALGSVPSVQPYAVVPQLTRSDPSMIKTKSVHEPIHHHEDGLRILVTRFRGLFLPKTRYDVWMANLGPSEPLLKAVQADQVKWPEFRRRYRKELYESGTIDDRNATIKNHGQKFTLRLLQAMGRRGNVTLMCHCGKDPPDCHRHILKKVLAGKI